MSTGSFGLSLQPAFQEDSCVPVICHPGLCCLRFGVLHQERNTDLLSFAFLLLPPESLPHKAEFYLTDKNIQAKKPGRAFHWTQFFEVFSSLVCHGCMCVTNLPANTRYVPPVRNKTIHQRSKGNFELQSSFCWEMYGFCTGRVAGMLWKNFINVKHCTNCSTLISECASHAVTGSACQWN